MSKDILDKLELKNYENLSEKNFDKNIVLGMNRDLDKLKINDDVSNENIINNEYTAKINNSYVELNNVLEKNKK